MTLLRTPILLIFLILHASSIFGQKNNFFSENNWERDSIYARELYRTSLELNSEGLYMQALDSFQYCLELRQKLYGQESYHLGYIYFGMGTTYRNLGQYDLALENFKIAEKNYLLREDWRTDPRITLFINIGNVYQSKLDYSEALRYYKQSLNLYMSGKSILAEEIASKNYNIALNYYLSHKEHVALEIIHANINNAYAEDQILYYELLAYINQVQNNLEEAKLHFSKSMKLIEEYEENPLNIAFSYLNHANFSIELKDFEEAKIKLQQSFDLIKITEPVTGTNLSYYYKIKGDLLRELPVESNSLLAFSEQKKDNLEEALKEYVKGLEALQFPYPYSEDIIKESGQWLSLMNCIILLKYIGDTYKEIADIENKGGELNSLKQAIENYQIASLLIQRARKELSSDESKIQLTELEHSTFQELVKTAFLAYSKTQSKEYMELAFQSTERTKGSSVFDKLSNELALGNSLIPDSLIQLEKELNNTISIYSEKKYEENNENNPDKELLREYDSILFETNRSRDDLNSFFESEYPDYYELKYSNSMLSLSDIQQKLGEEETIVEYVLNETDTTSEIYTLLISKNDLSFNRQKVDSTFLGSVETMFQFMSNPEYMFTTNNDSKDFCVSSHHLYKILISPFYDKLKNQNLIVVPDGKISYIAFDALLQSLPDTSKLIQFNKLDYLIKEFSINYTNSSNLLFKLRAPSKKLNNKVLAFAPEYNSDIVEIANQEYVLLPLPGVQEEVDIISQTVSTELYKGTEASEANFRKNIENYDILHLAMHAFINDSLPAFSRLAFSLEESQDLTSDGWINTTDIYNLNLNAQLTVLSACNTGRGKLRKGEGLMSLARGFFYAGCPSIIMSLWEVEDQSGTQIMGSFYKNLKKGKSKAAALRLAKLEYLESSNSRRAHPHYWLSYINLGDNSPLYKSYDFYFFILLVLILAGIFTDQLYKMKKARKKRAF